jgi:hypothetical protein
MPSVKIPEPKKGFVPKVLHWQQMPKVKLNTSLFATMNPDSIKADVDFDLLTSMFFRPAEEIKAEEDEKKRKAESKVIDPNKTVLENKKINDVAITLKSLSTKPD